MIQVEIEKEIRQENKIVLNLNVRQAVCLGVAVVFSVVCAVFLGMEFSLALYPCLAAGACCFAFGWGKVSGLPLERVLAKKLEAAVYRNRIRACQTKNLYIVLLNREYGRRRAKDSQDRKVRRQMRKERRERKARRRKSGYHEIL